jgi:DNA-directed RNA polymerase specialized sigma24 family protein
VIEPQTSALQSMPAVCAPVQRDSLKRSISERFHFSNTPHLITALSKGNEEAFGWLHGQWNSRIYRYCYVLARGDDALAGEIVQSVYLRIFKHIRPLPDEQALWNWIARAARNARAVQRRVRQRPSAASASESLTVKGQYHPGG